ncbi:MAG: protein kinase [Terriglobia bacterium]
MAGPDKEKDERSPRPQETPERTTPYGTPEPSESTTADFDLPAPARQALGERYDLLEELGRGGMGIVYRARDRETGAVVALKVLQPEIANRPELIERFKSELLLARKITHKNVCRVYDLARFGNVAAISMEYVEGESLRQILNRFGGVPFRRGLEWTRQICSGLAEAHSQGVIHRDLKPENILIDRRGQAKIMDFGIARSLETDATRTGTLIGTPAYMSPEQAEAKPPDARSDIYSLGHVLYEMFTGRRAFYADTPVGLALKQIQETPPPPREVEPDLPERLDRAIQRCLEKNPKKRFQSVADLDAALTEKPEAKPVKGPEGEPAELPLPLHLARWQRSDWLLLSLAIAGLLLFFPFFERTSLAPRSQVTFDRSILGRIAQEYAERLGAPVSGRPELRTGQSVDHYDYLASRAGAQRARELANNPVTYWWWDVEWEHQDRGPTYLRVDNRGSLRTFSREFPPAAATETLSLEEARPLAEAALQEFFNRDPASLTLETAASDTWSDRPATSFTWLDPKDYHGVKRRYTVRLVGKEIALLDDGFNLPGDYPGRDITWQYLPGLALMLLVLFPLAFIQRRSVQLGARWRVVLVAATCVIAAGMAPISSELETGAFVLRSVTFGLAMALLMFFVLIALEWSVRRASPARFASFPRLFDRRVVSEPCGLAIVRGSLIGLALLGADALLVSLATAKLPMWLANRPHVVTPAMFVGSAWPSVSVVLFEIIKALLTMIWLGFLASIVARFVRRGWAVVVVAAALSAPFLAVPVSPFASVQPYHWKLLLLVVDCLVLAWAFTRFDLLTLLVTMFTFAFCWQNYSLLVMLEPTGALTQWIAFALGGLIVLAAAIVAFQTQLRAGYRRVAAAFE